MSLKWPKLPINDPNDSSNEQNQPTSMMRHNLDLKSFCMNGFRGVYSWWPDYANTNICIYSGLTRARWLFQRFPFLSQFMLIRLFVPICVNSSVGISLDYIFRNTFWQIQFMLIRLFVQICVTSSVGISLDDIFRNTFDNYNLC